MALPADDQSHFSFGSDDADGTDKGGKMTIDKLWEIYGDLDERKLNDRSEEGQNLRAQIREFIEENDLDIRVDRKKSNLAVLEEIQDLLESGDQESDSDDDNAPSDEVPEDTEEDEVSDNDPDDEDDSDNDPEPPRRSRNDDTNEPAARPARRTTRPGRRR